MSTKQETLDLLEQLPEDVSAWNALRDEAWLLRGIARAESEVRDGRTMSLEAARERMELKWQNRDTKSK